MCPHVSQDQATLFESLKPRGLLQLGKSNANLDTDTGEPLVFRLNFDLNQNLRPNGLTGVKVVKLFSSSVALMQG